MSSEINSPEAFHHLFAGAEISRPGWRNKFHLAVLGLHSDSLGPMVIRVWEGSNSDGSKRCPPWTPTEDDLFASDYVVYRKENGVIVGTDPVVSGSVDLFKEGSFSWALRNMLRGEAVGILNTPLTLRADCFSLDGVGCPCLKLTLPSGATKLWRPQQQDLFGEYCRVEK